MRGSIGVSILAVIAVVILIGATFWAAGNLDNTFQIDNTNVEQEDQEEKKVSKGLIPIVLTPDIVELPDGSEVSFRLASGFDIAVAADGLGKVRFMAMSPDGRMFVPDLVNYTLSHEGRLNILEDFNEETKSFETTHTYLSGLRGPNSVAFYTDKDGQTWLYLALTEHLLRYPYEAGDIEPSGDPEVVTTFPNTQSEKADSVVWHITRTLLFHKDKLYISIGSGCNSCEQLEEEFRGMITRMDPDGGGVEVYADGLRNAVGIEWAGRSLYATANGVDHLGPNAPDERMFEIGKGKHYGWPYCYEVNGEIIPETSKEWQRSFSCKDAPHSLAGFTPRSAPLGLAYFDKAHNALEGTFLVALHGSFEPQTRAGYEIVRVTKEGEQEIFMDGFQAEDGTRYGRPVDILQKDKNSFFFTDDFAGRVYYVYAL